MKTKNRIFYLAAVLLILASCNEGELYFHYNKIEKENWYSDSVLTYTLDSLEVDKSVNYNISLELMTSVLYPYKDMHLRIEHNLNDSIFRNDTLNFKLTDDYGKWLGTGVGSLRQLSVPYKASILLDTAKSYKINIFHLMNDNPLLGVDKVGLRVYKDISTD